MSILCGKKIFAGALSEKMDLATDNTFINSVEATVVLPILVGCFIRRPRFSPMLSLNTIWDVSHVHPVSVRDGRIAGALSEHKHLVHSMNL